MLTLQGVSKQYGELLALDHATFEVPRGRIVGFLGPNGAGKTTAMRCIFGLTKPDSGSIEWDGRPVTAKDRARFGYMPEERGLYPKMRVHDQLVHFARLSGIGADAGGAADRWLHRFGLSDRAGVKVGELSHGNQQRVQLAVALAAWTPSTPARRSSGSRMSRPLPSRSSSAPRRRCASAMLQTNWVSPRPNSPPR